MEMGESLIGAYMRQVRQCHTVAYNTRLPWGQGELDVVAVRLGERPTVWAAEVAVHLEGLNYGGYEATVGKINTKAAAAHRYLDEIYPTADATVEFWSPVVPRGLVERLAAVDVVPVVNNDFTQKLSELIRVAATTTKGSPDDSFRLLQILSHLRGAATISLTGVVSS